MSDAGAVRRFQIGDRYGKFLVQIHDFYAFSGADGYAAMEQIESVSVATDVKLVKVPKEIDTALFHAKSTSRGGGGGRLLVNRFKDFEDR